MKFSLRCVHRNSVSGNEGNSWPESSIVRLYGLVERSWAKLTPYFVSRISIAGPKVLIGSGLLFGEWACERRPRSQQY